MKHSSKCSIFHTIQTEFIEICGSFVQKNIIKIFKQLWLMEHLIALPKNKCCALADTWLNLTFKNAMWNFCSNNLRGKMYSQSNESSAHHKFIYWH